VQLRRRADRWELFFDCRRPTPAAAVELNAPGPTDDQHGKRGHEAVTVVIGPSPEPRIVLSVPERGTHRLMRGDDDGTLGIFRRSYIDRWYCRIVLPDAWLTSEDPGAPPEISFGCARTHERSPAMETAPFTGPPWRHTPGRVRVRLDQWSGLP
jgi:hypothetical protein